MKRKMAEKKQVVPIAAGIIVFAAATVGLVVALTRDRSVMSNVFEIGDYRVQFIDTFTSPQNWLTGQTVSKEIRVKNDTTTPVVARIKLTETWDSKDGVGLPLVGAQSNVRMAVVNYTENSGWTLDGTWYYSPVLQPGETSTSLITGVTLNQDADLGADWRYGGATYKLSAKAEVIQSELAATEWHKKASVTVCSMSSKAYALNNNSGGYFDIERVTAKPSFTDEDSNYYVQIEDESNVPVYLWLDNATIKWFSEADDIYLIENESCRPGSGFLSNTVYLNSLLGLSDLNTSRMTSMANLFESSNRLTSLAGLENWDTSNVTSFNDLFYTGGNGSITDIAALARWDVSKVTDMRYAFSGHKVVDVSPLAAWNVRSVGDYYYMFVHNLIRESICSLADWPVKRDASGFGMFDVKYTAGSSGPTVDAHCLDGWNIIREKSYDWFDGRTFILPSWAH